MGSSDSSTPLHTLHKAHALVHLAPMKVTEQQHGRRARWAPPPSYTQCEDAVYPGWTLIAPHLTQTCRRMKDAKQPLRTMHSRVAAPALKKQANARCALTKGKRLVKEPRGKAMLRSFACSSPARSKTGPVRHLQQSVAWLNTDPVASST